MASTIYLTLLAAVILGTDLTISDAEFLQQIITTTSAALDSNAIVKQNLELPTTSPTMNSNIIVNHFNVTTIKSPSPTSSSISRTSDSSDDSPLLTTHFPIITAAKIAANKEPPTTSASLTFTTAQSNTIIETTTTNSSTAENVIAEPPSSDSLTKGFSIPTYLPDFPALDANTADAALPGVPPAASSSLTPEEIQWQQEQLYLDAYNKHHAPKKNLTLLESNVTVQLGSHAYMPCHIRRLKNKPVSWVRVRDGHILSVDQTTFIADQRFQSIFKGEDDYTWSLQIKYVQASDEGWYECQVSTEPKMSAKVYLSVVVPLTELIGDQNRFVKAGSKVALHCIVRGTIEPPTYIIWFRGKTQVMDDNKMGWYTQIDRNIFGNSSDQQNTVRIGSLIIPFVRKKDSGNYTCQPSNSATVSVDLHVLSGEYSASAIMSAAATFNKHNSCYIFLLLLLAALLQRT